MNKTLLSLLCCFLFLIIGVPSKAEIPEKIVNVICSDSQETLYPLLEEQLQHTGTKAVWDVILERIDQIQSKLSIDIKIKFDAGPLCLQTSSTNISDRGQHKEVTFVIQYGQAITLSRLGLPSDKVREEVIYLLSRQQLAGEEVEHLKALMPPIELPSYIMLSHEMLHMLLRLDYIFTSMTSKEAIKKANDIKSNHSNGYKAFNAFLDQQCPNLSFIESSNKDFLA
ncbi:MAG: hypothetical protein LBF43_01515 [Puniceicoccales bacterium]|jgi:hypothetical protein|nr:hypothetical protein [Puniceicoccales bacterium]